jgi:hypothetical protein
MADALPQLTLSHCYFGAALLLAEEHYPLAVGQMVEG